MHPWLQALVDGKLLLDPVPHESAQQQGSLLVAYSSAANQVRKLPAACCLLPAACCVVFCYYMQH
jgi:hypothetical protein